MPAVHHEVFSNECRGKGEIQCHQLITFLIEGSQCATKLLEIDLFRQLKQEAKRK